MFAGVPVRWVGRGVAEVGERRTPLTLRQTSADGAGNEDSATGKRSGTRRRSASVTLGMTAVLATALLGCGGPDEQYSGGQQYSGDEDGYGAVCVEEDTQLRVDDDRCDDEFGNAGLAWYYLPLGFRVGGVGQRVTGGSFAVPPGAQVSRGGVPREGGVVSRGGFGGKPGSFGG